MKYKMPFPLMLFLLSTMFTTLKSQRKLSLANIRSSDESVPTTRTKAEDIGGMTLPRSSTKKQINSHKNISDLLDNLLSGYDNSIRPSFGGPPAVIEVDIMVRSMGPISEIDMTYSMDLYFRQSWVDKRLAFQGNKETLALSITMLEKIWKPDTYFYNGKQSYLHTITTPNKFVRLYQDGRVLYSSRLTIKAGCPMNLENFPMDTQRCPLKFGSFGYTTNDVIYKWNSQRQIVIAEDMKLSQFDLIANISTNQTDKINIAHSHVFTIKEYSMLLVSFHLQRHMGNFLIQVYGPCILLVVLSWVSFWLNREATADRVSLDEMLMKVRKKSFSEDPVRIDNPLPSPPKKSKASAHGEGKEGITTVLTMTFLGLEARTDLPKVPYPTALDFFVFLSFAFIFATIIQFAVVHYFTKYGSGECYFGMEMSSESGSEDDEPQDQKRKRDFQNLSKHQMVEFIPLSSYTVPSVRRLQRKKPGLSRAIKNIFLKESDKDTNPIPFDRSYKLRSSNTSQDSKTEVAAECMRFSHVSENKTTCAKNQINLDQTADITHGRTKSDSRKLSNNNLTENIAQAFYNFGSPRNSSAGIVRKRRKRIPRYNSVSKIDKVSRIVFPILFAAINVLYWYSYLIRSERINRSNK